MNEDTKKVEQIEQDAKQEVKPAELSDKDLDQVAGGAAVRKGYDLALPNQSAGMATWDLQQNKKI